LAHSVHHIQAIAQYSVHRITDIGTKLGPVPGTFSVPAGTPSEQHTSHLKSGGKLSKNKFKVTKY